MRGQVERAPIASNLATLSSIALRLTTPADDLIQRVLASGILAWQAAAAPVNVGRPRWDLERQVRLVAGSIVLLSILASIAAPAAKWVAALLGAGLTVAALTNTCAMGILLGKLPYNRGSSCDLDTIVGHLRDTAPAGNRP